MLIWFTKGVATGNLKRIYHGLTIVVWPCINLFPDYMDFVSWILEDQVLPCRLCKFSLQASIGHISHYSSYLTFKSNLRWAAGKWNFEWHFWDLLKEFCHKGCLVSKIYKVLSTKCKTTVCVTRGFCQLKELGLLVSKGHTITCVSTYQDIFVKYGLACLSSSSGDKFWNSENSHPGKRLYPLR